MKKIDKGCGMKKICCMITIIILLMVSVVSAEPIVVSPSVNENSEFCGCIKRIPVNEPFTVDWNPLNAEGVELKIIHYYYDGVETDVVETTDTAYTFNSLPKSSRHFEIKARSFNTRLDGTREYSIWISSTDKIYAVFNGESCGWLIFTVPGTPSW